MDQYQTRIDLALGMAKATTRERVKDCSAPFALLYEELVRRKEIPALGELKDKVDRWNEVKDLEVDRRKKIWICQGVYVWDLITK